MRETASVTEAERALYAWNRKCNRSQTAHFVSRTESVPEAERRIV